MKRWTIGLSALLLGASVTAGYAGSACCAHAKAAPVAAKSEQPGDTKLMCGEACFKGIQLTADQKSRVADLMDQCQAGGCTTTSAQALHAGLQKLLTGDQLEAMKANCEKHGCEGWLQASS